MLGPQFFLQTLCLALALSTHVFFGSQAQHLQDFSTVIYEPPKYFEGAGVLNAVVLKKATDDLTTLFTTWEQFSEEPRYFPIYHSTDLGHSFSEVGRVYDTQNNWNMRFQPSFFELPEDFGGLKAGDILLAGISSPHELQQTSLDIYVSQDDGRTWTFVTNVANGGSAFPVYGASAITEPHLLLNDGKLIVYYSDQRDARYTQKLVYQWTNDLITWSDAREIISSANPDDTLGSPNVVKLGAKGPFMFSYHVCCTAKPKYRIRYLLSSNPMSFTGPGIDLVAQDGSIPQGTPRAQYLPLGKVGLIILSSAESSDLFINWNNGDRGSWQTVSTQSDASYGRSIAIGPDSTGVYLVGAGYPNGTLNKVQLAYQSFSET